MSAHSAAILVGVTLIILGFVAAFTTLGAIAFLIGSLCVLLGLARYAFVRGRF